MVVRALDIKKFLFDEVEQTWKRAFQFALVAFSYSLVFKLIVWVAQFRSTRFRAAFFFWDSHLYLSMARFGYPNRHYYATHGWHNQTSTAFFPLFSILARIFHTLFFVPLDWSLVLVAFISSIVAFAALFRVVAMVTKSSTASRLVLFLALSPGGFVFTTAYSEPLFMACVGLFFYFLFKECYFVSALFSGAAMLTRISGVLLIPVILLEVFRSRKWRSFVALLSVGVVIAGFLAYHQVHTGSAFAYFRVEKDAWGVSFDGGKKLITLGPKLLIHPTGYRSRLFAIQTAIAMIVLVAVSARDRVDLRLQVFAISYVLMALLSSKLWSLPRFATTAFPIWIPIASRTRSKRSLRWSLLVDALLAFTLWSFVMFGTVVP